MLDDLRLHARIQGGGGNDFLEQGRINPARARERDQRPTRAQQFEGQQVDVLIAARSLFRLGGRGGKFWRIEDDQFEGADLVPELSQLLEDIPCAPLHPLWLHPVLCSVLAPQR